MLIDITLKLNPQIADNAPGNRDNVLAGHMGTHFDVMDREFPLEYTRRPGILFNVSHVTDREIGCADMDLNRVGKGMFVAFRTGFIERIGYGTKTYYAEHPELSVELIEALLDRGVSIIALDFAGVRRGKEHTPMDRRCAERGTFVVENLCNLQAVLDQKDTFVAHTYPLSYDGITGLPCRVIAEV